MHPPSDARSGASIDSTPEVLDPASGSMVEKIVFNHRPFFLTLCLVLTVLFVWSATRLVVNASFDRMIPQNHPYIKNYLDNRDRLAGVGNVVRVVIENPNGDIFAPAFLEATRKINDELFLVPGVDRAWVRSIWMSSVRWTEVTEEGFRGGTVMPETFDGSPASVESFRRNVQSAGLVGNLVGNDFKSIMIVLPLLERDAGTGERLNYGEFSRRIEEIRQKYSTHGTPVRIKVVGFAKLVGDLIDGLIEVMQYFAVAAVIALLAIYFYTRDVRSTLLVVGCSGVAVVWLLGANRFLGLEIDPYSVLVPFLVFAIGVSHGAQKMNGIMQDIGRGIPKYMAARLTFRRLFLAGLTALVADAVGFGVLVLVDVPVIQQLALSASIGVGILIFTNLLLLPVMLSYTGVSASAARRSLVEGSDGPSGSGLGRLWGVLELFTTKRWASAAVLFAAALVVLGYVGSLRLKVGDLDPGAPELRAQSRYNQDVVYINGHYRITNDQFVVMAKTADDRCSAFKSLLAIDELSTGLRQLPGVVGTLSLTDYVKGAVSGFQEGNPKWYSITRNEALLGTAYQWTSSDNPEVVDKACSTVPIFAYLSDHKAETLDRVVSYVERFARENDNKDVQFLLAAGPAGVEAVTNLVVTQSNRTMLLWVYGAVTVLCLITFRSWRATVVAIVPLAITSLLCEALMAALGIGMKVATLPVVALGVGIGVDYSLYLLSVQLAYQRAGRSLADAHRGALAFTGKVVGLVGVTLAGGVVTWVFSPIKFQADMGILLTFMFLWNMLGALILIPALSYFLLPTPRDGTVKPAMSHKPGMPLESSLA